MAVFVTALSQTIVATALPRISAELGRFGQYAWTVSAYAVAVTIVIPIAGGLSDRYGRRLFLLLGVSIFTIASLPAGWSPDMGWMALSRVVQGVGGGMVSAVAIAAVADLFAPEERGKHLGLVSAAYGVAFLIGPPLGGLLTDLFSWRWTLWLNVPLGALIMLAIAVMYPETRNQAGKKGLDLAGMTALLLSAGPILLALSCAGVIYPWTSPFTIGLLVFGAAMATVFLFVEKRAAAPIMPLGIYRLRAVAVSIVVMLLTGFVLYGSVILLPLFFQGVLGLSAAVSGGYLTSLLVGMAAGGVASGQLVSRTGGRYRVWGLAGTCMMTAGAFLMAAMHRDTSAAAAMACMSLTGLGLGFVLSTFALAVQNSTPASLLGAATSALQFFRQLGGMLGLAAVGPVLAFRFASRAQETAPAWLQARIPPARLEALTQDPQALLDPSATEGLRGVVDPTAAATPVDTLLAALRVALGGAVGDVLLLLALAAALSAAASLLLKVSVDEDRQPHPRTAANQPRSHDGRVRPDTNGRRGRTRNVLGGGTRTTARDRLGLNAADTDATHRPESSCRESSSC